MTNEEELLYNEIYKKTKDCGRAQFIKLLITERRNNRQLKEKLKATGKGLNKVLYKRKKWKDRYYKEQKKNKWLHQRDTYTDIVHSHFQLEKKEKRYYENILDELEKWLEKRIKNIEQDKEEFVDDLYNNFDTNTNEIIIRDCELSQLEDTLEKLKELKGE